MTTLEELRYDMAKFRWLKASICLCIVTCAEGGLDASAELTELRRANAELDKAYKALIAGLKRDGG